MVQGNEIAKPDEILVTAFGKQLSRGRLFTLIFFSVRAIWRFPWEYELFFGKCVWSSLFPPSRFYFVSGDRFYGSRIVFDVFPYYQDVPAGFSPAKG